MIYTSNKYPDLVQFKVEREADGGYWGRFTMSNELVHITHKTLNEKWTLQKDKPKEK